MSLEDIKRMIEAFASAALRAKRAGFDLIEFHFVHGYLVPQFWSPTHE
jgi:NADPH2 dehydrogenase